MEDGCIIMLVTLSLHLSSSSVSVFFIDSCRQTDRQKDRNICNQFHLSAVSVPIWVCDGQYEPVKSPSNLSVSSVFQQILTRKYYNLSDEQTSAVRGACCGNTACLCGLKYFLFRICLLLFVFV